MITEVKITLIGQNGEQEYTLGNVVEMNGSIVDIKTDVAYYADIQDGVIAIQEVKKEPAYGYMKLTTTLIDFGTQWEHTVDINV